MSTIDRKAQLVAEATRLFSRRGFDEVTVKELARVCGITEPAVYRHFVSKDAIYDAVLDSLEERMDCGPLFARLESENDVEVLLHAVATHVITFFTRHDDMHRLLLFSALKEHTKARKVYDVIRGTYVRFLAAQLDRLYRAGAIVEKNNEITARCYIGMVFDCALGRTLWRGMQGKLFGPEEVVANNVPIYARGLRK
ncbi:MAG: TetR/AcrR family transcriptional regulator [candidate division Zixibacteria bacterium]|jgi:AcrR family transcriptional regulator|nr:TetR/AcrR family transcriptional regulator [candidate division Zixibacteria bacterium]